MIKKLILLLALCCLVPLPALAARGCGATSGNSTTDIITNSTTITWPTITSVSVWFNGNNFSTSTSPRLMDAPIGAATEALNFGTAGTLLNWSVIFSTSFPIWNISAAGLTTGVWHHLVITYDGSSTSNAPIIYLDGVSKTVANTVPATGTISNGAATISLCNRVDLTRSFNGIMAEYAQWSGVILKQNEVTALFNGASPLKIQNLSLLFYAPLYGSTVNERNWGSAHNQLTVSGTTTKPHAPVQPYPNIVYGQ